MDEKKKPISSLSLDEIKFVRESLLKELEFRREKQWRIFSWVSSILVGVTAGIIALNGKDEGFEIRPYHKGLLIFAIVVLTAYACIWIRETELKRKVFSMISKSTMLDLRFRSLSIRRHPIM
jgi:membrane protein YdbS with pleckstrin-like domain